MATHASRNPSTGLNFENTISMARTGSNLTKHNLYKYLDSQKIDYKKLISKKLLPDEAYFNSTTGEFTIFEKKYQETAGSADEKPQTCAFKLHQFKKIGKAIGATKVTYTYIFNNWFAKPEYKDMLEYIRSVDGCDYIIVE